MAIAYTNAEVRSILNGLGFRSHVFSNDRFNPDFPLTDDNSPLTDEPSKHAIRKFQTEYKLTIDGVAGPETEAKLEEVMNILQDELRKLVNPRFPTNDALYGSETIAAVKEYQRRLSVDGIATLPVRESLYIKSRGSGVNQAEVTAV